jgi:hypothetical protein
MEALEEKVQCLLDPEMTCPVVAQLKEDILVSRGKYDARSPRPRATRRDCRVDIEESTTGGKMKGFLA